MWVHLMIDECVIIVLAIFVWLLICSASDVCFVSYAGKLLFIVLNDYFC